MTAEDTEKLLNHPKIEVRVNSSRSFPDRVPKVVIVPSVKGNFDIYWSKTGRQPYRKLDLVELLKLL